MKYIVYQTRKIKCFGKKRKKFTSLAKAKKFVEKVIEKNNKTVFEYEEGNTFDHQFPHTNTYNYWLWLSYDTKYSVEIREIK